MSPPLADHVHEFDAGEYIRGVAERLKVEHWPAVPFSNNVGERAVPCPSCNRKSQVFSSFAGAEHFCVIRSCLDTLRTQVHCMLTGMQRAFASNPVQPPTFLLNIHLLLIRKYDFFGKIDQFFRNMHHQSLHLIN